MTCRVLFGGMSSAGKSTFVCSLYEVLDRWGVDISVHELDIWSDTHDCILGYKPWEQRRKRGGPAGDALHPEFVEAVRLFREDDKDVVLGDLPGRRNPSWWSIARGGANAGVVISRQRMTQDSEPFFAKHEVDWEQQMKDWNIPVIARVHSLLPGQHAPPGRIPIIGLERVTQPHHPEIEKLAELVLTHAESLQTTA